MFTVRGLQASAPRDNSGFVLAAYLPYLDPALTCVLPPARALVHSVARDFSELILRTKELERCGCSPPGPAALRLMRERARKGIASQGLDLHLAPLYESKVCASLDGAC